MEKTHSGVWILAEQSGGRVQAISFELLTRGRELADRRRAALTAVLLGSNVPDEDLRPLIACGADRVLFLEAPELIYFLCEPFAACLGWVIDRDRPEIFIAGATSTGRTLMPYLAVKVGAGLTADCTMLSIDAQTGNLLQTRPAIGGNIMATIVTPKHRPQMATVRPRSTPAARPIMGRTGSVVRMAVPSDFLKTHVRRLEFEPVSEEKGLSEAEVVVCVGRGIKKAENVGVARKLAELLNGAVGATRDVVDRGWLSYPHQIGLSGKTITPKLYIGLGVSGSIQHLAGMQTAETIVAVNRDPEAMIFKVADFGIVGDLFEVVPALIESLKGKAP